MQKNKQISQSMLVSPLNKQPELYKWKIASLIVGLVVILVFCIAFGLEVYIQMTPVPKKDTTFLNEVILESNLITTKDQLKFLSKNLLIANPQIDFQFSNSIKYYNSTAVINQFNVVEFLRIQNRNLLFVIKVSVNTVDKLVGLFIDTAFPVLDEEDFLYQTEYYTFDVREPQKKEIAIIGIDSQGHIQMNGTVKNKQTCRQYILNTKNFNLLHSFNITMNSGNVLKINSNKFDCFNTPSQADFEQTMKNILGFDYLAAQTITITGMQVFHLF